MEIWNGQIYLLTVHLRAVLRPGVLTSNTMGPLLAVLLEHPWHRICVLTLDHKLWAAGTGVPGLKGEESPPYCRSMH